VAVDATADLSAEEYKDLLMEALEKVFEAKIAWVNPAPCLRPLRAPRIAYTALGATQGGQALNQAIAATHRGRGRAINMVLREEMRVRRR